MKESQYVLQEEEDVEAGTSLATRMERKKKTVEASLIQQGVNIANEIEIPPASLLTETVGEDAQKVIKLAEDVQELVTKESDEPLKVNLEDQRREGTSEAATSKAAKGISPRHTISDFLIESDTQTSLQPQSSNQPSDDFVIDHLFDQSKGELPGYVPNSEKASRIASEKAILESPQQHQPEKDQNLPTFLHINLNHPINPSLVLIFKY